MTNPEQVILDCYPASKTVVLREDTRGCFDLLIDGAVTEIPDDLVLEAAHEIAMHFWPTAEVERDSLTPRQNYGILKREWRLK